MKFYIRQLFSLLLISILFFITACKKQEYFRSEQGVDNQLQGSWKRIRLASSDPQNEIWNFSGGTLTVTTGKDTASGTYSIHTTLFKAFIHTDNLSGNCGKDDVRNINAKWQVITLDDNVLDIASDVCGGVMEREFTKQ